MKVIIETDLTLDYNMYPEDHKWLDSVGVYFTFGGNTLLMHQQKIRLEESDMSHLFEIMSHCGYLPKVTWVDFIGQQITMYITA